MTLVLTFCVGFVAGWAARNHYVRWKYTRRLDRVASTRGSDFSQ